AASAVVSAAGTPAPAAPALAKK
ncbi:MAG: hypothetical protein JWP65_612, partial [Ramlibacter sp.]|nr:hypothetical protein [Ramlibacter sp.]